MSIAGLLPRCPVAANLGFGNLQRLFIAIGIEEFALICVRSFVRPYIALQPVFKHVYAGRVTAPVSIQIKKCPLTEVFPLRAGLDIHTAAR